MKTSIVTLKNLIVSYKVKHTSICLWSQILLLFLPREMKMYINIKDLFANVHSSFIHNNSNLETNWMPINRQMSEHIVIQAYMENNSPIKRNKLLVWIRARMNLKQLCWAKRPDTKECIGIDMKIKPWW